MPSSRSAEQKQYRTTSQSKVSRAATTPVIISPQEPTPASSSGAKAALVALSNSDSDPAPGRSAAGRRGVVASFKRKRGARALVLAREPPDFHLHHSSASMLRNCCGAAVLRGPTSAQYGLKPQLRWLRSMSARACEGSDLSRQAATAAWDKECKHAPRRSKQIRASNTSCPSSTPMKTRKKTCQKCLRGRRQDSLRRPRRSKPPSSASPLQNEAFTGSAHVSRETWRTGAGITDRQALTIVLLLMI